MNNKQNPYKKEKNPSYRQDEWAKTLNKQGYISCCQLISSMKGYISPNFDKISKEEKDWFCNFSWWFLTAIKEKVNFCEDCLVFYGKLKVTIK